MTPTPPKRTLRSIIYDLNTLLDEIPDDIVPSDSLSDQNRRKLKVEILRFVQELKAFAKILDPILQPDSVFDPSDPSVIGRLIAKTLLERPKEPLCSLNRFYGSGVYAIYYNGNFSAYQAISGGDYPIYVGKVDPKTSGARSPEEQGDKLWNRLVKDHASSIEKANNLSLDDFECRFLVVKSAWQNTAENYLIDWFKPVWNNEIKICRGFGKHGDSSSTRNNTKSPWDTLHPGRKWALDHKDNPKTPTEIRELIMNHYETLISPD